MDSRHTLPTIDHLTAPPVPDRPAPQARVPGYEVLEEIGRGGMGVVYKARHLTLGREAALKVVLAGAQASDEERRRFLNEARVVAALDHPGIVPVHECGTTEDGLPFLVMALCSGGSLERRLGGKPLAPPLAAQVVEVLARSVQAAHDKGIIHRDLKPANVLLTHDGQPLVADFGLARTAGLGQYTGTGGVLGTPAYMAPEQAQGKKELGHTVDVYALGAILYECLTGRPPFLGATAFDTLVQVVDKDPVPPRSLNAKVPRDLETVCLACLHKVPERRYNSAQALAEDLERWRNGEPIRARPVGAAERVVKWVRRNPAVAGLVAAVAGLLVVGTAVATLLAIRAESNAEAARQAAERADVERQRADGEAAEARKLADAEGRARRAADAATGAATAARGRAEAQEKAADEARRKAEAELTRAEWLLYGNQITGALRDWETGHANVSWGQLSSSRWDFRSWESRYLHALFHQHRHTISAHRDDVLAVAFSPDGRRFLSAGKDRTVRLYDARTGEELALFKAGPTHPVVAACFSPDGEAVASLDRGGIARLWDVRTGRGVRAPADRLNHAGGVQFSADGKRLFGIQEGDTSAVVGWDMRTGRRVFSTNVLGALFSGSVMAFARSPDGTALLTCYSGGEIVVWDARTGSSVRRWKVPRMQVRKASYSPDGTRALTVEDDLVRVWSVEEQKELLALRGHALKITAAAFSPDGGRIATASQDRSLKLWDAQTGELLRTYQGHLYPATSVAFSPDGACLLSGGEDNTAVLWDGRTAQGPLVIKAHQRPANGVEFSPDGREVYTAGEDNFIRVWGLESGKRLRQWEATQELLTNPALSPDGLRVASEGPDKAVTIWDARTGRRIRDLAGHKLWPRKVAFSPNGSHVVSTDQRQVKVWVAATGKEVWTTPGKEGINVRHVAFTPDGLAVVGCIEQGEIQMWSAATGKPLRTLMGRDDPWRLAFSRDGKRMLVVGYYGGVQIWDTTTWKELLGLNEQQGLAYTGVFSADGARVFIGGRGVIRIRDATTGQLVLTIKSQPAVVRALAVSPDGTRLASVGEDGSLYIHQANAKDAAEYIRRSSISEVFVAAACSPDGSRIVTGAADGAVRLWDAKTGQPVRSLRQRGGAIGAVAFSADGGAAFVREKAGAVSGWSLPDGKPVSGRATFPSGPPRTRLPDGRTLRISSLGVELEHDQEDAIRKANQPLGIAEQARSRPEWHQDELDRCLKEKLPFGALFHLDRLIAGSPHGPARGRYLLRRERVLEDHPVIPGVNRPVELARHSARDRKALLAALGQQTARAAPALTHRALAAVQLRAGAAESAIASLTRARRLRPAGSPPVEELILAMAHRERGETALARRWQQEALTWRGAVEGPAGAAAVVMAGMCGPLAAAVQSALPAPDPRRVGLDGMTLTELDALFADADERLTWER